MGEIVDLGSENNIIEKSGSWYSYKGERIGQGRDNAVAFLGANPQVEKAIAAEVYTKFGIKPPAPLNEDAAAKHAAANSVGTPAPKASTVAAAAKKDSKTATASA